MNFFVLQVISEAKVNLTVWGYIPGDPFPENTTIRDGKLVLESYCIVLWIFPHESLLIKRAFHCFIDNESDYERE